MEHLAQVSNPNGAFNVSVVIPTDDSLNLGNSSLYEDRDPECSRVTRGRSMPFIVNGFAPHASLLRPLLTAQLGVESTRLNGALAEI
jgi:hypothetical protein